MNELKMFNKIGHKKYVLASIMLLIIGFSFGYVVADSTTTFTITSGVYPSASYYTMWVSGSSYYVKNRWGRIVFSGSNASEVLQDCIAENVEITILEGSYDFDSLVTIGNNMHRVKIRLSLGTVITINNDVGWLKVTGSQTYFELEGGQLLGVTDQTGYGVIIETAVAWVNIHNVIGRNLKNYLFYVNAVSGPVNYIRISNILARQCEGVLYAQGPSTGRSISLQLLLCYAYECTGNAFRIDHLSDVTISNIIGESYDDFFKILGKSSAIQLSNVDATSFNASVMLIDQLAGQTPQHIFGTNIYCYSGERGMTINAVYTQFSNFRVYQSELDGIWIKSASDNVRIDVGSIRDSSLDGAGLGCDILCDSNNKIWCSGLTIASTNPKYNINITASDNFKIFESSIYGGSLGTINDTPSAYDNNVGYP